MQQQRTGDHQALKLAAAHLVGIFAEHLVWIQLDKPQLFLYQTMLLLFILRQIKVCKDLVKNMVDRIKRIIGVKGVLKNCLYLLTVVAVFLAAEFGNIFAAIENLAVCWLCEAEYHICKRAFAASAFPYDCQRRRGHAGNRNRGMADSNDLLLFASKRLA